MYLDCAATVYPDDIYMNFLLEEYDAEVLFGNPSSVHFDGIQARRTLEQARHSIAESLHCNSQNIVFTSGGTESDNMAIKGTMLKYKPDEAELITTEFEHPAVLNSCKQLENMGYTVHYIKPTPLGFIELEDVINKINDKTKMVSIMKVNNEIGTIQPVNKIAEKVHYYNPNIVFHSDMVQSIPYTAINFDNIDLASFSGHKFGGLKGTGFLYKKENIELLPIIAGGEQENGQRAGTENVFGALIMANALGRTLDNCYYDIYELSIQRELIFNTLVEEFGLEQVRLNGAMSNRLANNLNISFKDIDGRTLQYMLSQECDIYVSTGSACTSNSSEPSHVLRAIDTPEEFLDGNIRISLPVGLLGEEIELLIESIIKYVKILKEGD